MNLGIQTYLGSRLVSLLGTRMFMEIFSGKKGGYWGD